MRLHTSSTRFCARTTNELHKITPVSRPTHPAPSFKPLAQTSPEPTKQPAPPPPLLPAHNTNKQSYNKKNYWQQASAQISCRLRPSPTIPRIPVHTWPLIASPPSATVEVSTAAPSPPVVVRRPSSLRCKRLVLLCEGYATQTSSRRVVRRPYFVSHLLRSGPVWFGFGREGGREGGKGDERTGSAVVGIGWARACVFMALAWS